MRWIVIGREADLEPPVRAVLEELSNELIFVEEATAAVQRCRELPCDGAVLLGCPPDGISRELVPHLRDGPNGDRMAILVLVDPEHLDQVSGIDPPDMFEFVRRPVDPVELRTRARLLLRRTRVRPPAERWTDEDWRLRFQDMERLMLLGTWDWDIPSGRMRLSAQACRNLGVAPEDAPETYDAFLEHLHPSDREEVGRLAEVAFRTHREVDLEYRVQHPDGKAAWLHARGRPELDESGEVVRIYGTVQDVTHRYQLEEQLRQSQKMESVGRLAGGIAHDFNNLLTTILGNVELLSGRFGDLETLSHIRQAGERAASLTGQLLAFSRRQVLRPRVMDVSRAVAEGEALLRRLIGEDVEVVFEHAPQLWTTRVDPGQLQQVLLNLAVNARDAMPTGGRLAVRTANTTLEGHLAADVHPGEYVMLAVEDTGHGMDADTRARIFEPFFTTKEQGRGTGLGLSTVFGIVKQSGGHIEVESEVGVGTTFRIYLPRTRAPAEAAPEEKPEIAIPEGREVILLVEDEMLVRNLARRVLEQAGYAVLPARDAEEALQAWEGAGDRIELLITDVVMPGLSGPALADRLLEDAPDLPVLFMSGYTPQAVSHHGLLDNESAFLQKPFTSDSLLHRVREILTAARHGAQ
ncbi:MAG: ATP-binding protein [Myxococcota bacterium]